MNSIPFDAIDSPVGGRVPEHVSDLARSGALDVCIQLEGGPTRDGVVTFSLAERRALRLLARAGLLPTLPRREAG